MKQWSVVILILLCLAWHLAVPVNLMRSDIGRHIKNGELILQGNWNILYKNYYSYSNPEYPFLNYHWLFGVVCFVFWHFFGFGGLSAFYLILELATFYIFLRCAERYSSFLAVCAFALLSFPFLTFRSEIRPEGFSYLFCGLFWWLMDSFRQRQLNSKHLMIVLSLIQVIWVNTHIFFIMGPLLAAFSWLQALINKEKQQADVFKNTFLILVGACLINPFGINMFWLPFDTWNTATSFPIIESQSLFYVLHEKIPSFGPILIYFLVTLGLLCLALLMVIRRDGIKKYIFISLFTLVLALASMKVMRMIGLWGYFWIPISTYVYSRLTQKETAKFRKHIEIVLIIAGIAVSSLLNFDWHQKHGLGIVPGSIDAAEFFKREKIMGPIFNNYGIGGYLIFYLSPQQKLFIDNRGVAAFPEDFIKTTYVQMQWDESSWHKLDGKYHFNAIFCSPEQSYWSIQFFANRLVDPDWALVYESDKARILLKRNLPNASIISRYEIHVPAREAEAYNRKGFALAQQGDFTQAIILLKKAIEMDRRNANAYNNLGYIYGVEGNVTEAMADFNKAIEINPSFTEANNNRAFFYNQSKNSDKARP